MGADAALAAVLLDCLPGFCGFQHAASPLGTPTVSKGRTPVVRRFAEDALVSQCGAVAVQLPTACRGRDSAAAVAGEKAAGVLWHASRGWLAVRLLFVVSLCRGLQAIVRHLRSAPAACALLTDLYTHTLTRPQPPPAPSAGGGAAAPPPLRLPPPALGVFVGSWSSAHAVVQEAAQLIMAACTAPIIVAAAEAEAVSERSAAATQARGVPRSDSLRDLSTRGECGGLTPLFGWEAVPGEANGGAAAPAAGAVALLPQEVLGILHEAPQQPADPMQVLLSAATCAMQPRSIPHTLPPAAIRRLCALALSAPAPHSAAAASILADMLHSAEGHRWQPHLGALPPLFSRLHDALMRVHRASTAPSIRTRSPPASTRSSRTTRRPGATPSSIAEWLRKLPARHRALLLLPDIRATYYVRDPETHAAVISAVLSDDPAESPQPASVPKSPSDSAFRIDRMLSFYHTPQQGAVSPRPATPSGTPPQDAHDVANSHTSPSSLPHSNAYSAPSPAELQNTRDTLTSLLAAVATLDFSAFLHSFNTRIAVGAALDPSTPFHTAALNAMLALLRTHSGCEIVLQHVTVLAESMLRLLDPASGHRRIQTLNVRRRPDHACQACIPCAYSRTRLTDAGGRSCLSKRCCSQFTHALRAASEPQLNVAALRCTARCGMAWWVLHIRIVPYRRNGAPFLFLFHRKHTPCRYVNESVACGNAANCGRKLPERATRHHQQIREDSNRARATATTSSGFGHNVSVVSPAWLHLPGFACETFRSHRDPLQAAEQARCSAASSMGCGRRSLQRTALYAVAA